VREAKRKTSPPAQRSGFDLMSGDFAAALKLRRDMCPPQFFAGGKAF